MPSVAAELVAAAEGTLGFAKESSSAAPRPPAKAPFCREHRASTACVQQCHREQKAAVPCEQGSVLGLTPGLLQALQIWLPAASESTLVSWGSLGAFGCLGRKCPLLKACGAGAEPSAAGAGAAAAAQAESS